MEPLRILTWHVHGSYLDSLIRTGHTFFVRLGAAGRAIALERFGIDRFVRDWNDAIGLVADRRATRPAGSRLGPAVKVPA